MSERSASTFRQGQFTAPHIRALQILSENHIPYLAEETVRPFGRFDSQGRPISYKVDILINCGDFGSGVIEIDGIIHKKLKHEKRDEKRDADLRRLGLWVEHIENWDVSTEELIAVLEKHRRARDDYS